MRNSLFLAVLLASSMALAADTPEDRVRALADPSPEVREAARRDLLGAGAAALAALREGLRSKDPRVVLGCLDVAESGGIERLRQSVRERASDETGPALIRRAAIRALGRVGDYRDLDLLAGLLPGWPEAALALGRIGDEDAVPDLEARWTEGESPEVAFALVLLGEEKYLEPLVAMVDEAGDSGLRALAFLREHAQADAGATSADWAGWLRRERLARKLGAADFDASERALRTLFEGLSEVERGARIDDLLEIARDRSRPRDQRTKAVRGLGTSGEPSVTTALLHLLFHDPDGLIRVYAAEAVGRLGRMDAAVDLVWYLVNDEEEFRKLSAKNLTTPYYTIDSEVSKALVRLGVRGGLDYMIRQLGESHRVRVYHQAVRTLRGVTGREFGFRPDARAADRLAAAARWREWFDEHRAEIEMPESPGLKDPVFRRRVRELVLALGHWKFLSMSRAKQKLYLLGESAVPELIAGLTNPELHIRAHCAELLGSLRARGAREALARALDDPRTEVQSAAAAALAEMGPGSVAGALLEVLEDPSPARADVRIAAVRALALVPGESAVRAVRRALSRKENDSDTFRREASYALAAHGSREALDRLVSMLERKEVAWRQVVSDRIRVLLGRDPGVTSESIAAFREWWKVNRDRYSPGIARGAER